MKCIEKCPTCDGFRNVSVLCFKASRNNPRNWKLYKTIPCPDCNREVAR